MISRAAALWRCVRLSFRSRHAYPIPPRAPECARSAAIRAAPAMQAPRYLETRAGADVEGAREWLVRVVQNNAAVWGRGIGEGGVWDGCAHLSSCAVVRRLVLPPKGLKPGFLDSGVVHM